MYTNLTDEQLTELFFSSLRAYKLGFDTESDHLSIEWFRNHVDVWIVDIYLPNKSLSFYVDTCKLEELVDSLDYERTIFIYGDYINARNVNYIKVKILKRKEESEDKLS